MTERMDAEQASNKVRAAMQELADIIGPRTCPHETDWADCDIEDCGYDNTEPFSSMIAVEDFVIVCGWMDMVKGERFTMCFQPKDQSRPRTKGLLWVGLEEF